MCKEGWRFGLGHEGGCLREDGGGGDCLKYLKWGWNRKEGRGSKANILKSGKPGQGVGAFKKEGLEPPQELCYF